MLCYQDRTFCKSDCVNKACRIRLTDEIWKDGEDFGLPVAHADFSQICHEYEPPKSIDLKLLED